MQKVIVIKGRLVGPKNVELDEAVVNATEEVEVIVRTGEPEFSRQEQSVFEFLRCSPAGTRSREEIDRQIHDERENWGE